MPNIDARLVKRQYKLGHKVYDKNRELVSCSGPFEKFLVESDKEPDINKALTAAIKTTAFSRMSAAPVSGSRIAGASVAPSASGAAASLAGASGAATALADASGARVRVVQPRVVDLNSKIDWLIKTVKDLKDEAACKKEIKVMMKEIIREEVGSLKQELEELKRMMQKGAYESPEGTPRNFSDVVKERKKENILIIKPKSQQESEVTKRIVKEKIDIKKMEVGKTKLRKGGNGALILGCESGEEMERLKATVQATMGEEVRVTEPQGRKPKIKIVNFGGDEIKMDDDKLIDSIKKQNRIDGECDEFCMRMEKRIFRGRRASYVQSRRGEEEEGFLISG